MKDSCSLTEHDLPSKWEHESYECLGCNNREQWIIIPFPIPRMNFSTGRDRRPLSAGIAMFSKPLSYNNTRRHYSRRVCSPWYIHYRINTRCNYRRICPFVPGNFFFFIHYYLSKHFPQHLQRISLRKNFSQSIIQHGGSSFELEV